MAVRSSEPTHEERYRYGRRARWLSERWFNTEECVARWLEADRPATTATNVVNFAGHS